MCALGAAALHAQAGPLDTTVDADIRAQALSDAVLALSRQAGVQVLMPAEKLDRYGTAGLRGRMSLRQALGRLLEGTPYRYRESGGSTIVIDTAEPARH